MPIIYIERINNMKKTNESGFSITELAVSCAIMMTLTLVAMPHYIEYNENLNAKIEYINEHNRAQEVALQELFDSI